MSGTLTLRSINEEITRHYANRADWWVYFMEDSKGRIKIGCSKNVERRRKEIQANPDLQCEFTPGPIRFLAKLPGDRRAERILHDRFSFSRWDGEWFLPAPELLSLIAEVKAAGGAA